MNPKEIIYTFIESDNMRKLEVNVAKPKSVKVKVWRILKEYEKETGKDPEVTISIEDNKVILTKEAYNATFILKDGREVNVKEYMKGG